MPKTKEPPNDLVMVYVAVPSERKVYYIEARRFSICKRQSLMQRTLNFGRRFDQLGRAETLETAMTRVTKEIFGDDAFVATSVLRAPKLQYRIRRYHVLLTAPPHWQRSDDMLLSRHLIERSALIEMKSRDSRLGVHMIDRARRSLGWKNIRVQKTHQKTA